MMEFSACAKTHKDANVFLDLLRMRVSPQVPEHSSMFDLKNLLDKGEAFFFVVIWNMYNISKKISGNVFLVSETQHLLSNSKLNCHFLQSP